MARIDVRHVDKYFTITFSVAKAEWLPVDGFSGIRVNEAYTLGCNLQSERWILEIPKQTESGKRDTFDVTEAVERLLKGVDCERRITSNKNHTVAPSNMIWKLDEQMSIAISELRISGKKGHIIHSLNINRSVLLKK